MGTALYQQSRKPAIHEPEHIDAILKAQLPSAYNCLVVDLEAIAANYRFLCARTPHAQTSGVVKGDGYGLGAIPVSLRLQKEGCTTFFVAFLDEGVALRQALGSEATIYVLSGYFKGSEQEYLDHKLIPVLTDIGQIESWQQFARFLASELPIAIHVNTGLHRTGMPHHELLQLKENPQLLLGLNLKLVMSHLACSGNPQDPYNAEQRQAFIEARQLLPLAPASLANSAGIFLGPEYHFNWVRPGLALYGLPPYKNQPNPLSAVMSLWARITQIQSLKPGQTVGYAQTYIAKRPTRIAAITIGHADGVPFSLANKGAVKIGEFMAPIVGRISMDLLSVDITDIPESALHLGQWVELLGAHITLDQWATWADSVGADMVNGLGRRLKRVYHTI